MHKNTAIKQNKVSVTTTVVALIALVLGGFTGYLLAYQKYDPSKIPTENRPGYITADAARSQVNNFYKQYLNPKKESPEEARNVYISKYGDKNLVFYKNYYQHGFDPIVCSATMPISVTAKTIQPGAGAVVNAEARYPDGSTSDITLTLVLNSEGFRVDSITCPGDKGNLLPKS